MARRNYRRQYPRLYRRYPEHGLGEPGTQLTKREVRAAAELAGFSPGEAKQMMQISLGESNRHPGIRGDDPGGTKGWGLAQNTPGVWGAEGIAYMNKLGGEAALRNPIKNMKMARFLYESAGNSFTPWYGTSFLNRNLNRSKVKSVLGKRGPGGKRGAASGNRGPGFSASLTETTNLPGVDNSALRQDIRLGVLSQSPGVMPSQEELLGLAGQLQGTEDIPGATLTTQEDLTLPGRPGQRGRRGRASGSRGAGDIRTGSGQPVMQMLRKAVKWDKAKAPYLWGGGHGSIAKPGDPVDCSGFVSAVLGLDVPQVSGNLTGWGKPGRGRWISVFANDGHVLMSIRDPRTKKVRWFGTSRSNPGGGAGEIAPPDAGYLSRFTARHPG